MSNSIEEQREIGSKVWAETVSAPNRSEIEPADRFTNDRTVEEAIAHAAETRQYLEDHPESKVFGNGVADLLVLADEVKRLQVEVQNLEQSLEDVRSEFAGG